MSLFNFCFTSNDPKGKGESQKEKKKGSLDQRKNMKRKKEIVNLFPNGKMSLRG